MNAIILEKDEKGFYDVLLSEEIIDEIKSLELAMSTSHITSEIESNTSREAFLKHINELIKEIEMRLKVYLKQDDMNENLYRKEYIDELEKIREEYDKIKQIKYEVFKQSPEIWLQWIKLARKCYEVVRDMNFFREYESTKEDIFQNIRNLNDSIISETLKKALLNEYEQALEQRNLQRLDKIVDFVNQKVLLEWQNIGKNLGEMTDDHFCFLGHSTLFTERIDEFYKPLISTSLYNQDVNDTFRRRFGFIMQPVNIVATDANDLYVDNNETSKEKMFLRTKIAKIDLPSRLLSENKKLMQENASNGVQKVVYNEVVLDVSKEFQPLGVFCFTTGALDYDYDLEAAKKLAENNNLPLYTFDVLASKKGAVLEGLQLQLLNNIQRERWRLSEEYYYDIKPEDLKRYQYFFKEFAKLKKTKNYTSEQIKGIFARNTSLITNSISGNDMFSGKYSADEIITILNYNYSYNIDEIISNKFYTYTKLEFLTSELKPYVKELDKYCPNFSKFIFVLSKMEITDELVETLNQANTTDILELTKILALKLKKDLETSKVSNRDSLRKLENEYQALQNEEKIRTKMQTDYENAKKLDSESWRLKYEREELEDFTLEFQNISQEIALKNSEKTSLESEKAKLESSIEELSHSLENIVTSSDKALEELQKLEAKLQHHPYLNFFKLKKLRTQIATLKLTKDLDDQIEKLELKNKITTLENQLITLDNRIASLTESINKLKQTKDDMKIKIASQEDLIKSKYGSLDFEVINKRLEEANDIITKYDYFNEYHLKEVKEKLEKLKKKIALLQNEAMSNSDVYTKIASYVSEKDLVSNANDTDLVSQNEVDVEESTMFKK